MLTGVRTKDRRKKAGQIVKLNFDKGYNMLQINSPLTTNNFNTHCSNFLPGETFGDADLTPPPNSGGTNLRPVSGFTRLMPPRPPSLEDREDPLITQRGVRPGPHFQRVVLNIDWRGFNPEFNRQYAWELLLNPQHEDWALVQNPPVFKTILKTIFNLRLADGEDSYGDSMNNPGNLDRFKKTVFFVLNKLQEIKRIDPGRFREVAQSALSDMCGAMSQCSALRNPTFELVLTNVITNHRNLQVQENSASTGSCDAHTELGNQIGLFLQTYRRNVLDQAVVETIQRAKYSSDYRLYHDNNTHSVNYYLRRLFEMVGLSMPLSAFDSNEVSTLTNQDTVVMEEYNRIYTTSRVLNYIYENIGSNISRGEITNWLRGHGFVRPKPNSDLALEIRDPATGEWRDLTPQTLSKALLLECLIGLGIFIGTINYPASAGDATPPSRSLEANASIIGKIFAFILDLLKRIFCCCRS